MTHQNQVFVTVYENKEATAYLAERKLSLSKLTIETSRRDAEEALPRENDTLKLYLDPILAEVQTCVDYLAELHRADEKVFLEQDIKSKALNKERNVLDDINQLYSTKAKALAELSNTMPSTLAIFILALICLLGFSEGLFSLEAIRCFIPSYPSALGISLIFGFGLTILAHKIYVWWIDKAYTRLPIVIGMSLVFLGLGVLRSYNIALSNLSLENDDVPQGLFDLASMEEAVLYMLVSWVVFLPAVLLSKLSPSLADFSAIIKKRALKKELKLIKQEQIEKQKTLTALEREIDSLNQLEYSRLKTAQRDEKKALNYIELIRSLYIKTNIKHRFQEANHPNCFVAPFNHTVESYFQNTNTENPKTKSL